MIESLDRTLFRFESDFSKSTTSLCFIAVISFDHAQESYFCVTVVQRLLRDKNISRSKRSNLSKRSSRVSFSFTEFKKVEIFLQHVQLKSPYRTSVIIDTIVTKREKERMGRHSPLEFKYHFSLSYFYRLFSSLVGLISSITD